MLLREPKFIVLLLLFHFCSLSLFSSALSVNQVIYESASPLIEKGEFTIIEENRKLGIRNNKGVITVSPTYKKIRINTDNTISGLPFTEWKVLDGNDKLIRKFAFDTIAPIDTNLIKVTVGNLQALADNKGNLLTDLKEWTLLPVKKKYALVKEQNKYGLINAGGKIAIPILYDTLLLGDEYIVGKIEKESLPAEWQALHYSGEILFTKNVQQLKGAEQGYFAFSENGSWGFFNYLGNKSVPNQYDHVSPFINGKAIAEYLGSDGVINGSGKWLIMPRKDSLKHVQDDIYLFRFGKESGLISTSQGELFTTTHEFIPLNHGFLEKNDKGKVGLISPEGHRLLLTAYDEISALQNDTVYFFRKDNHWGIITKHGQTKLSLKNPIQEMFPMGDLFIGVKIANKYGFVDTNGDLRIANQYEAIGEFSEDMAAVKLMGRWGFVDRIERLLVQPLYEEVFPFKNGTAIVKRNGQYGLVNKSGDVVLDPTLDSLYRTPSGRFIGLSNNRQGLIAKNGRILIHPKYDEIKDLDNGFVIIKRNNNFGLLTTNGISTIPLMYDALIYNPFDQLYYAAQQPQWKKLKAGPGGSTDTKRK